MTNSLETVLRNGRTAYLAKACVNKSMLPDPCSDSRLFDRAGGRNLDAPLARVAECYKNASNRVVHEWGGQLCNYKDALAIRERSFWPLGC